FITTSTPAIYIALISYHPQLIPTNLVVSISASRKNVPFPGIVEVILMGLVFEILREGGVRLPRPIGQAISIVGAIVLGEAAVSASLVSAPMIIVVGVTGVAGFVNPALNDIAVLIRLLFVFLAAGLGLYGYVFGTIAIVLLLSSMESFGVPYLSTMTTIRPQDIKDTVVRVPWWQMRLRPRYLATKDRQRLQRRTGSKGP
ncbi:MAG TPA: spore germination protein, partial [Firmicutes bacterium]|nr:spore germination protein [Bacillota bacterium]